MIRHFFRNAHGATLIEFAIAAPVFFLFITGTLSIGHALWVRGELQNGVAQAARLLDVRPTASDTEVRNRARSVMNGGHRSSATINVTTQAISGVNYKIIDAAYTQPFLRFIQVTARASVPVS